MTLRGFPVTPHLLRPPCKVSGCPPPVSLLFRNSRDSEDTALTELGLWEAQCSSCPGRLSRWPRWRPRSRPGCTCFCSEAPCPSGPLARATLPLRLCPWPMMAHPSGLISDFLFSGKPPHRSPWTGHVLSPWGFTVPHPASFMSRFSTPYRNSLFSHLWLH